MGLVFEELIRWANERSNETAGDHYTPREVISLMVELLFATDDGTRAASTPSTTKLGALLLRGRGAAVAGEAFGGARPHRSPGALIGRRPLGFGLHHRVVASGIVAMPGNAPEEPCWVV
jgi:hypothetical protein